MWWCTVLCCATDKEQAAAAVLTVNVLCVRVLYQGWSSTPASFTTLRVPGACLVSAATDGGGIPKDVEVESLAGRNCSVMLPKGWSSVVVRKLDTTLNSFLPVTVVRHIDIHRFGLRADNSTKLFEFETVPGEKYGLLDGASLEARAAPMPRVLSYSSARFGIQ